MGDGWSASRSHSMPPSYHRPRLVHLLALLRRHPLHHVVGLHELGPKAAAEWRLPSPTAQPPATIPRGEVARAARECTVPFESAVWSSSRSDSGMMVWMDAVHRGSACCRPREG